MNLAREALARGGGAPAVMNAANEVAVAAFLEGKISFPDIVQVVSETCAAEGRVPAPATVGEAEAIDGAARRRAGDLARRVTGAAVH